MLIMSTYFTVLLISLVLPLALSFYRGLHFYRHWPALLCSITAVTLSFGLWDVVAVYRGHWHFDEQAIMGARILNLPFEEILFFIVIPFCCIFSWETVLFLKGRMR